MTISNARETAGMNARRAMMTERTTGPGEARPNEQIGQPSRKAPKPPKPRKVEKRRKGRKG